MGPDDGCVSGSIDCCRSADKFHKLPFPRCLFSGMIGRANFRIRSFKEYSRTRCKFHRCSSDLSMQTVPVRMKQLHSCLERFVLQDSEGEQGVSVPYGWCAGHEDGGQKNEQGAEEGCGERERPI
jgi:hypothetical protein